jgi:hypothetical protein
MIGSDTARVRAKGTGNIDAAQARCPRADKRQAFPILGEGTIVVLVKFCNLKCCHSLAGGNPTDLEQQTSNLRVARQALIWLASSCATSTHTRQLPNRFPENTVMSTAESMPKKSMRQPISCNRAVHLSSANLRLASSGLIPNVSDLGFSLTRVRAPSSGANLRLASARLIPNL